MAVKRIMCYLKNTIVVRLCLGGFDIELSGCCNGDYTRDTKDLKSTTGYMIKVGLGAISWISKLQLITVTSTVKAEYMAINHTTKEAIWLKRCAQEEVKTMMLDNEWSISLAKNPTHHSCT